MDKRLRKAFIDKLEKAFGPWDESASKFGHSTYGKISKKMSISASQFSKLINGSATDGMYSRSIRNVVRVINQKKSNDDVKHLKRKLQIKKRALYVAILLIILSTAALLYYLCMNHPTQGTKKEYSFDHPLSLYFDQNFDANFDSPYLKQSEVQEYCPCSAYEGEWALAEEYVIPLPGNKRPGIYYIAKSADIRMKCSKIEDSGSILNGYEYLVNEIWVDVKETPLSPIYFNPKTGTYTETFKNIDFEKNNQFKKVATIHSFFVDKFTINEDSIMRAGEPVGRFARDIDNTLINKYEINLKYILEDVLGDLNKADCSPMANTLDNPNKLSAGETILSFDCKYTISNQNLGLENGYPYTKAYKLVSQNYSDNLICE